MSEKQEDLWFKRKTYGFGWVPASWQGWAIMLVYLAAITLFSYALFYRPGDTEVTNTDLIIFVTGSIVAVAALLFVTTKKGPTPKWRWGKKPRNNPKKEQ